MTGFVKLYGTILDSTIWLESLPTKVVWITMLAMADSEGFVSGAVPTLAKRAGVSRAQCESALAKLSGPDEDSQTSAHEGRRIEKVEGGWVILNHRKYRDLRTDTQIATAERVRKHRAAAGELLPVTNVTPGNEVKRPVRTEEEEEEDTEAETDPPTHSPAVANFIAVLPEGQKRGHWLAIIHGWMQGLGFEGGKAATAEDVATGLTEYLATAKRDFAVIHVRSFVERAYRNRLKSAARTNGKPAEDATRLWDLIKSRGLHHMTTPTEFDREIGILVSEGKILNAKEFKNVFGRLNMKTLRKAEQDSFAIRHIAEMVNGSLAQVLA